MAGVPDNVAEAMGAISRVLGEPDRATQKIVKWHHRDGLTVNLHRESVRHTSVWVAGLANGCPLPVFATEAPRGTDGERSPKNGNHSREIKNGPHVYFRIRRSGELQVLIAMLGGDHTMAENTEQKEEVVFDELEAARTGDDEEALDIAAERRRVKTDKQDIPVETMNNWILRGKLDLQPEFQRNYVWDRKKASRLIESLLLNVPIPVIYVAEEHNGKWSVVDGQQRLTSIHSFVNGKFPDGQDFRLSGLQVLSELNRRNFKALPQPEQEHLLSAVLRLVVISRDSDPDVKFEVFERLNLGSEKLNDQELRNSMFRGPYNDLLKDLVYNAHLMKILKQKEPHKRMWDRQLILRFLAMWRNTHLHYKKSMKQFLNSEMQEHRHASPQQLDQMRAVFEKSIELAWLTFGEHAFRRFSLGTVDNPNGGWDKKVNVALFDTLLYIFAYYEKRQIVSISDAVREEFLDLMASDATFNDYITATTDNPERIRYRAEAWKSRLDKLVTVPPNEPRSFSREWKRRLFEANPTCGICGNEILHMDDAEVDHVEAYWRGGATLPSNARLAHRYCNRAKGGR